MAFPKNIEERVQKLFTTDEYGTEFPDLKAQPDQELIDYFVENHGINPNLHRMCQACQIRQIVKYNTSRIDGYDPNKFEVKCKGVPQGLPPGSMEQVRKIAAENNIDFETAKKLVLSTIDPATWAEVVFGFDDNDPEWHLRPHQRDQLRCTSLKLVLREGRRAGKTMVMAIKLLYLATNMKIRKGKDRKTGKDYLVGPEIMVITPFQSQVDNLFEQMEKLIKKSVEVQAEIKTNNKGAYYTKTPFYSMEFHNGATISGFVSGVGTKQDGSGGGTMRGESAQIIYMDEMDMIPDEVIKSVIEPLLLTPSSGGVHFYGTSTPIGKRSMFYKWCKDRPDFKEYYIPSTVLSNWADVKRDVASGDDVTTESFQAEYLAKFVDGSYGVFKPSLVHAARADYNYNQTDEFEFWSGRVKDRSSLVRCIGIDWNKNAGTEFYVVAYDIHTGVFWGLEAVNIPSSKFSAEAWKDELKRLNYKWSPDYIYADEGYGHTIIEDLRLEAHRLKGKKRLNKIEEETIKLNDRLVSFNFSSKVELRDPVNSTLFTKPAKFFLVETAIKVFETHKFRFPESDKVLVEQLLRYAVLRISDVTGKPVYGPDNEKVGDHRLDAMMLAIGGIYLEKSAYARDNIPYSVPEMYPKDDFAEAGEGYVSPIDVAEAARPLVPRGTQLLAVMRGSGSNPMDDRLIRKKYQAEEYLRSGKQPKRSRGDLTGGGVDPGTPPANKFATDDEDLWRYEQTQGPKVQPRRAPKVKRRSF